MERSALQPTGHITRLGNLARRCLEPGKSGTVLATFSKAIYLLTDANELFWIATEDTPLHRRCAALSSALPAPAPGTRFHVESQRLMIDPTYAFSFANARVWSAAPPNPKTALERTELPERVSSFFSGLDLSQARGFGNFIPHILSLSHNGSTDSPSQPTDRLLLFAQPFVLDLARACLTQNPSELSRSAEALIGLGAGLTPSGDDFLGGLLFAAKILETTYPQSRVMFPLVAVEAYSSRTHLISFTLLKDHASGHAVQPLHEIIHGLISGKSLGSISTYFSQLIQVGHSTGWDLLAGLLTGLLSPDRGVNKDAWYQPRNWKIKKNRFDPPA
jgi:hypothetical protein